MEAWQARLLEEARTGTLGTIAAGRLPQLVPVCYALVEGGVAIAIDEKPKCGVRLARVRNIERDPRASLLVDHYEERWERLAWVRLDCAADVLAKGVAWPEALAALRCRYPRYRAMALETRPLIRLRPTRVVGLALAGRGTRAGRTRRTSRARRGGNSMRIGLMVEGQNDLTWERWLHIATLTERLGFASLFRSDHYFTGARQLQSLEAWVSFASIAREPHAYRFGALVTPVTFRRP